MSLVAAISRSGGYLGQAIVMLEAGEHSVQTEAFARAYAARDALALTQLTVSMEKWKREQLIPELEQWRQLLEQSLACRAGGSAVTGQARSISASRSGIELMAAVQELEKCIRYAQGNVSVAAICGYLQWALR